MISANEKNLLKALVQSSQWGVLQVVQKDMIDKVREDSALKDTIDETALKTAFNEGQIYALNQFLKEIIQLI